MLITAAERFYRKICITQTGCWEWTRYIQKAGYGVFRMPDGLKLAHRISYELSKGPIPVGLELDHLCRNRKCVNPDHLEAVTHRENVMRGDSFMADRSRQTQCKSGHQFSQENTINRARNGRTHRECRECGRIAQRAYKARIKHQGILSTNVSNEYCIDVPPTDE